MCKASEAILALKPVTFHYKQEIDPEGVPQFGLVSEDVEKVNPDLVARDQQGKPYTVRYEAVNAMLLNEFLKEHRKVQELEANAARQQKQIEALITGLQRVSRTTRTEQTCTANGEQSVKVVAVHRTAKAIEVNRPYRFAISRRRSNGVRMASTRKRGMWRKRAIY